MDESENLKYSLLELFLGTKKRRLRLHKTVVNGQGCGYKYGWIRAVWHNFIGYRSIKNLNILHDKKPNILMAGSSHKLYFP